MGYIIDTIRNYHDGCNISADISSPCGPVGLLIQSLHHMGASLGTDLVIRKEGEASIDLWNLPWQHLKKALTEWCFVTRSKHVARDRTHLQQVDEIDTHITKNIISCLGDKERNVYSQHIFGRSLV